jgi:hypothetical protein
MTVPKAALVAKPPSPRNWLLPPATVVITCGKAEGGRQKAESSKQKAVGSKQ